MSTTGMLSVGGMIIAAAFAVAGTTQNVSAIAPSHTQCSPFNTAVLVTPFGSFSSGFMFVQQGVDFARCSAQYRLDLIPCLNPELSSEERKACQEAAERRFDICIIAEGTELEDFIEGLRP
jgi:hypothetical protein